MNFLKWEIEKAKINTVQIDEFIMSYFAGCYRLFTGCKRKEINRHIFTPSLLFIRHIYRSEVDDVNEVF